jgi:archaellum component FlaC
MMKLHIMAILGLMSVMLVGTAFAEEIRYTGDDIPLRIVVSQGDTLYFTGTDKIPNMNVIYPNWISQPCSNSEATGKCVIDFSNFPLGGHEWESSTGVQGKFHVMEAIAEVDDSYENVSQQAKDFKAQIEAKMDAKLAPLQTEITQLKLEISNANEREVLMQNQITTLKADLTKAHADSQEAMSQIEQLSKANTTIEQYKKDAENWRAVALEQLKVMAEVLGLF